MLGQHEIHTCTTTPIGVETNSYTAQIGKIKMKNEATKKEFKSIYTNDVRCPEKNIAKKMKNNSNSFNFSFIDKL